MTNTDPIDLAARLNVEGHIRTRSARDLWQVDRAADGRRAGVVHVPRHPAFVLANLADFRLFCANHHRELTLTGRIEGTEIVQWHGR